MEVAVLSPDDLRRLIREATEPLERRIDDLTAELRQARAPAGMEPDAAYTTAEAARLLGIAPSTLYKINRALLPRTAQGRFLGRDLAAYRQGRRLRRAA